MATPYPVSEVYQGNQAKVTSALGDRPMTEMETFTAQLADTARRLTSTADRLQDRVDSFVQAAQSISTATPPQVQHPEPQPGTLGALRYWHKTIEEQSARLADTTQSLAGIL